MCNFNESPISAWCLSPCSFGMFIFCHVDSVLCALASQDCICCFFLLLTCKPVALASSLVRRLVWSVLILCASHLIWTQSSVLLIEACRFTCIRIKMRGGPCRHSDVYKQNPLSFLSDAWSQPEGIWTAFGSTKCNKQIACSVCLWVSWLSERQPLAVDH